MMLFMLLVALCAAYSMASMGIDISQKLDESTASCLKGKGVTKLIPRGFRSSGTVDPNM